MKTKKCNRGRFEREESERVLLFFLYRILHPIKTHQVYKIVNKNLKPSLNRNKKVEKILPYKNTKNKKRRLNNDQNRTTCIT